MDTKKQMGSSSAASSSSSSFTDTLFGNTASSPSSSTAGVFSSLFPPPSSVAPNNYSNPTFFGTVQKHSSESQARNSKQDDAIKHKGGAANGASNKDKMSIFQERAEPCPLSSSLYYGGQDDVYFQPANGQTSGSYTNYKKVGRQDDPNGNNGQSASRGNWWEGSLYY